MLFGFVQSVLRFMIKASLASALTRLTTFNDGVSTIPYLELNDLCNTQQRPQSDT